MTWCPLSEKILQLGQSVDNGQYMHPFVIKLKLSLEMAIVLWTYLQTDNEIMYKVSVLLLLA